MSENKNCPQCGSHLISGAFGGEVCPVCGWGRAETQAIAPPSGIVYKIKSKSLRWKAITLTVILVSSILITTVGAEAVGQWRTNRAISRAQSLIDQRLYASAARTLNVAAIKPSATGGTSFTGRKVLSNTIRWAHDSVKVTAAKGQISSAKPENAIAILDDVNEDFPQEDEANDLIDFAQDQSFEPEEEIDDELLDEIAYVPDDPELENLDEITQDAVDDEIITDDEVAPAAVAAAGPSTNGSSPAAPVTVAADEEVIPDEDTDFGPDDGGDDDLGPDPDDDTALYEDADDGLGGPDDSDEPIEPEEPVTFAPNTTPAQKAKSPKTVGKVPLYWSGYVDNLAAPKDLDQLFTINKKSEFLAKKDKVSGFSKYNDGLAMGQLYNRKPKGKKNIVPLYRYYSAKKTDHYYTRNAKFAKGKKTNYVKQLKVGYIGKYKDGKCLAGNRPLYRIYNKQYTSTLLVADANYRGTLLSSNTGWSGNKIIGCIW